MKSVVREKRIPFEIKSESETGKRQKAMEAFYKMREIAAERGLLSMTLEEINEEIRLIRRGE